MLLSFIKKCFPSEMFKINSPLLSFHGLLSQTLSVSLSFTGRQRSWRIRSSLKRSQNTCGFCGATSLPTQPDLSHSTPFSPSWPTQEVVELCVAELSIAVVMASTANLYFGYTSYSSPLVAYHLTGTPG